MKLVIECEMKDRWVPHFLGMLKMMVSLGSMGASRVIGFMADGDGDFRPKFKVMGSTAPVEEVADPRYWLNDPKGINKAKCDIFFDAG